MLQRLLLLSIFATLTFAATTPNTQNELQLRIHVYDYVGLRPALVQFAESESSRLLGRTIPMTWLNCNVAKGERCGGNYIPGEIIMRIVHDIEINDGRRASIAGRALPVDGGVYATIAFDRVLEVRQDSAPTYSILGKTMAHEIGHLLLGKDSHASAGTMRPSWSFEEFRNSRNSLWFFLPAQKDAMRQELYRRAAKDCDRS